MQTRPVTEDPLLGRQTSWKESLRGERYIVWVKCLYQNLSSVQANV